MGPGARLGVGMSKRRWLPGWRNFIRFLALLLAGLILWSTLTGQGRTTAKSLLFLPSLIPGSPVRPINWFTDAPERVNVTFSDGVNSYAGDLYLPATSPPHPGIVVSLGVNPAGPGDERVVRLGEGLARMGVAALIPYSDNLINKRVTPQEIDFTVAAFQYLAGRPEVDSETVGFLGVCLGSSLALLAAQDPRINMQVDFVNWFCGYYRLEELIVSVATRSYNDNGRRVPWAPDSLTREVVELQTIDLVEEEAERELLLRAIIDGVVLSDTQRAILSSTGSLVYRLFQTDDPDQARELLAQMPPRVHDLLRTLSPQSTLANLKARLYVMDDVGDTLIPYVESRALVAALNGSYARHSKFSIFSHVDLDRLANPVRSVPQLWSLFLHMNQVFHSIL